MHRPAIRTLGRYLPGIFLAACAVLLCLLGPSDRSAGSFPYLFLGVAALLGAVSIWYMYRHVRTRQALINAGSRLERRDTELATLDAIGREIVSSMDIRRVYRTIDRECRKIMEIDLLAISLVDPDTGELAVSYTRGSDSVLSSGQPLPDNCLEAKVVKEKRGFFVDPGNCERADLQGWPLPPRAMIRSVMAAPLIVADRVSGVLVVQTEKPEAYDSHNMTALGIIAQQAALAVDNARHHRMATVDSLTGFYLKDYFFSRVEDEYNRARRYKGEFALLMVDLDGFKRINDRNGHLAADRYLQALGREIRSRLRSADLACRFGGDEFCLLLPETDLAGAHAIGERLREAVSELHLDVDGLSINATVSVGVASFPDHDTGDLRDLLRRADQALYRAKRTGRDRVIRFSYRARPSRRPPSRRAGNLRH